MPQASRCLHGQSPASGQDKSVLISVLMADPNSCDLHSVSSSELGVVMWAWDPVLVATFRRSDAGAAGPRLAFGPWAVSVVGIFALWPEQVASA